MQELGIAVIGIGYWGMNYVRIFNELPESRVVVVCDRREERLLEASQRYPEVAVSSGVDEVLRLSEVDAVVVSTEAGTHASMLAQALVAGKHALVEKPMTTNIEDGLRVVDLAVQHNVRLMVGHTFLYHPGIRHVKECLDSGKAGRIYYGYARRTNLGPVRRDVNALWDLAPHEIAVFDYFFASHPEWVSAVGLSPLDNSLEDTAFAALAYPGGIMAQIHVSRVDAHRVREVVTVGSNARIVFDDLDIEGPVRIYERGAKPVEPSVYGYAEHQFLLRDGDIVMPRVEISEPLRNQCEHFVACVTTGAEPLTDGQNGLDVVRVIDAVDRSMAQRGAPVEILWDNA